MSESHLGVKIGDRVVLLRSHLSAGHSVRVSEFASSHGSFGEQVLVVVADSGRRVTVCDAVQMQPFGTDERTELPLFADVSFGGARCSGRASQRISALPADQS